ncbi:WD40 repeat-like protein, partial [Rhizodiscina lignyota]
RKGVSFLSRILAPNKSKNRSDLAIDEDDDETADFRPEGMDAQLFSHSADNVGFSPRHPQPPGYIKFRAKFKKDRDFDRVFLAQELRKGRIRPKSAVDSAKSGLGRIKSDADSGTDAIWALEFSKDGKYLAAAGQDKIVRVWGVLSSREERRMHEKDEEAANGNTDGNAAQHLSAPVFRRNPLREYEGHTSTVIDISWSKNNFLLSSSFDKTVRLWHVSRNECLVTFKHAEYCPSIQFHPRDDRFFLAGSLDTKLRLWSIPDKSVAYWNQLTEIITAVAFTPDGKTAIAGTMGGTCSFYDTDGLKFKTQINIKSSGRNAKPAKITSIQATNWGDDRRDVKLLISSNDSRIRLYNFRDKSLEMKFKGHKNMASQIRASFSDDSRFVISGSEDRKTYIWSTGATQEGEKQRPMEVFEAHNTMTTGAILAPRKTRMVLSASEDPVFDLCNPPPVTLISRSESIRTGSNASGPAPSGEPPDRNGDSSVQPTPATAEGNGTFKRAEESPAYLARTAHMGGNIIVTADYAGNIKVFRQDCAYGKR